MATAAKDTSGLLGALGMDEATIQRQLDEQRIQQIAEMTNEQRIASLGARAGMDIGRGIAGLFGVESQDPRVKQVAELGRIRAGIDPTNEESVYNAARQLTTLGFGEPANALLKNYAEWKAKTAEAAAKEAEKMTPEQRNSRELAALKLQLDSLNKLDKEDPRVKQALETTQARYDALSSLVSKERKTQVVGVAVGSQVPVYEDDKGQFTYVQAPDGTQIRKPYFGGVDRTTAKVTATAVSKGEEAFTQELGKLDAKRVSEATTAKQNAISTINSLDQLSKLDDQGLISGSFASGRVGATNLLSTLGLASPSDQQRLASSQNYQKVAGDVILGVLGGKLGAGFSNEDRKFIEGLVPQLETSAAARRQLISFMRRKNMDIAAEADRLDEYARQNKGLGGYKAKIPLGANVPATSLSADDLAKAAGGKIVNGKFVPNQ
jgi:hypothetical protein